MRRKHNVSGTFQQGQSNGSLHEGERHHAHVRQVPHVPQANPSALASESHSGVREVIPGPIAQLDRAGGF